MKRIHVKYLSLFLEYSEHTKRIADYCRRHCSVPPRFSLPNHYTHPHCYEVRCLGITASHPPFPCSRQCPQLVGVTLPRNCHSSPGGPQPRANWHRLRKAGPWQNICGRGNSTVCTLYGSWTKSSSPFAFVNC